MQVSVTDAHDRITDLIRHAEAGGEVVFTRDGRPTLRLVPAEEESVKDRRIRALDQLHGAWKDLPQFAGATSASLQDELYDEHGLPK